MAPNFFHHGHLQRNYRKMTIKWSFSYNSFVKLSLYITIHLLIRSIYLDPIVLQRGCIVRMIGLQCHFQQFFSNIMIVNYLITLSICGFFKEIYLYLVFSYFCEYRRKVHTTRTFFTPTTHEIRGMRVV